MPLILISTPRFADHQTPPGHPEAPERADVMAAVAARWRQRGGEVVAPRMATHHQLVRVHDEEYLRRIAETAGSAVAIDQDTYTSPDTYDAALLAAGAAVDAVERVMGRAPGRRAAPSRNGGEGPPSAAGSAGPARALALVRPPGHHAERSRAMGFCFFNNVAVAAAHARTLGASRVAIVDYDVHHGNGTQHIFEDDASVLYISTHQWPYYPGTGAASEIGRGSGEGFTVNLALEVGAVDEDYRVVFEQVVVPVLRQFGPDLVLVSAGFDAHERDPLAGMRLTSGAFGAMTLALRQVAEECCGGRIAVVTEGGYDLRALTESLGDVVDVLAAETAGAPRWPTSSIAPSRGRAAVAAAKASLGPFWALHEPGER